MISRGDRLIKESVHSDELKTKILSYRDREKRLEILKHPHIGAFAVLE